MRDFSSFSGLRYGILFLIVAGPVSAYSGRIDQDAHGLGMGGAVAAVSGGPHAVLWNPAGIARATVPMGQIGAALKPKPLGDGFNTVLLYPTRAFTVFGFSQFSDSPEDASSSTTYLASVGMPLSFTRDLLFGINLKYLSLTQEFGGFRQKGRGLGFDLGLSYDLHLSASANVLSFGMAVKDVNTQLRFTGTGEEPVTRTFVLGAAFQDPRMRGELDYEIVDRTLSSSALHDRLKIGVERFLMVRNFSVRAGYDDLLESGGHFSAGIGYHPSGPLEVHYAVLLNEESSDLSHAFSVLYRLDRWIRPGEVASGKPTEIDLAMVRRDVLAPAGRPVSGIPLKKRSLGVSPPAFSPNGDGKNDAVTITLPAVRGGEVTRWELDCRSSDGRVERRMVGTGSPPPLLVWDGVNEAGKTCRDGAYQIALRTYGSGDDLLSDDARLVDIASGKITFGLKPGAGSFSPLRGSRKMSFLVLTGGPAEVGTWEFEVSESGSGRVVYATQGSGKLPKRIQWNGKNAKGEPASDGNYLCLLVAEDKAGNRLRGDAVRVGVDTLAPELRVKVTNPWLDFKKTPKNRIGLDAADRGGLSEWRLVLQDDAEREVRSFEGRGDPPGEVSWDGTDAQGSMLPPGSFVIARLTGADEAGNLGISEGVGMQLAVEPPGDKEQMTLNLVTILFPEGNGDLSEAAKRELNQAAESIKPYLQKSVILLKGYTASTEGGDPLILARKRVVEVRRYLAGILGVPEGRLLAAGMGGKDPLVTAAGKAAPEKQRRVVVTLYTQP